MQTASQSLQGLNYSWITARLFCHDDDDDDDNYDDDDASGGAGDDHHHYVARADPTTSLSSFQVAGHTSRPGWMW